MSKWLTFDSCLSVDWTRQKSQIKDLRIHMRKPLNSKFINNFNIYRTVTSHFLLRKYFHVFSVNSRRAQKTWLRVGDLKGFIVFIPDFINRFWCFWGRCGAAGEHRTYNHIFIVNRFKGRPDPKSYFMKGCELLNVQGAWHFRN